MLYMVRMIIGTDKCKTITNVEAHCPEGAVMGAEMMFPQITVRVINVETGTECQNHVVPCLFEGHACPRCDDHLNDEGECTACV